MPVIVVGGGAGLCGDALEGAACIVKPPHADIANAVGAAIPQVGPQPSHSLPWYGTVWRYAGLCITCAYCMCILYVHTICAYYV